MVGFGFTLQACDGGPTAPKTGSLTINIGNLPAEVAAPVTVQGAVGTPPITVSATRTLADLTPGTYTVTAAKAVGPRASYTPSLTSQVVEIVASSTPSVVTIGFTQSTGFANVTITGLPAGAQGSVTVFNNAGFFKNLTASGEVTNLDPGEYTLQVDPVSADEVYTGSPIFSTFTVATSNTPVQVEAKYAATTGSIDFASSGLPAGAIAVWDVTGPNNYSTVVQGPQRLSKLAPGTYTVRARNFDVGAETYGAASQSAQLVVTAGVRTPAAFAYVTRPPTLNITVAGAYITQSIQRFNGSVPLIAGRPAFLRVFLQANEPNSATPKVRARFFRNGTLVSTSTINATGNSTGTTVNEGSLSGTWGVAVPASVVTSGLSYIVDIDPDNTVREVNETDNTFPASGTPLALDIRAVPLLDVRFVPIETSANSLIGNVTEARIPELLSLTMKMFPMAQSSADLRSSFVTAAPALTTANMGDVWVQIITELNTVRLAEGTPKYYVGILKAPYTSGIAGIGYVPGKTTLSWDASSASSTVAHELGHNWGRNHAPCGGPANPDPSYPYANARIGVFGFDVATGVVMDAERRDVMSYCGPEWVSDYTYEAILNFRGSTAASVSASVQSALMIWGRVEGTKLVLEPAFLADTRPSLPTRNGRYRVEGYDAAGSQVFSVSFDPEKIGDIEADVRQFGFAVPMSPAAAARIVSLKLSGEGREINVRAGGTLSTTPAIEASVVAGGKVRLDWNAAEYPMLVVRDPDSKEIIAFARGGTTTITTPKRTLDIAASNKVGSRRLTIPARN